MNKNEIINHLSFISMRLNTVISSYIENDLDEEVIYEIDDAIFELSKIRHEQSKRIRKWQMMFEVINLSEDIDE